MRRASVAAAICMGVLSAGGASAQTISGGSASFNGQFNDYNTALGTFNKFDTTLGTLNSVNITYGYGFGSTITVSATTASSGTVRTESGVQFYSNDSAINNVVRSLVDTTSVSIGASTLNPAAYDLSGTTQAYNVPPGTSQTFSSNASNQSRTASTSSSPSLAAFQAAGGGTFVIDVQTLTGLVSSSSGGNANFTQQTTSNPSFSINYVYSAAAAPEPAGWALMILGFGVSGTVLRRRTRSDALAAGVARA